MRYCPVTDCYSIYPGALRDSMASLSASSTGMAYPLNNSSRCQIFMPVRCLLIPSRSICYRSSLSQVVLIHDLPTEKANQAELLSPMKNKPEYYQHICSTTTHFTSLSFLIALHR